ncbi:MAG TPA: FAD-dependent oxidoreductase [Pseudonocardia sp.]
MGAGASVVVVGAGVVGLAVSAALRASGARVTCREAVGPMTQRSCGSTRIFRLAHGDPALVELAAAARARFGQWRPGLVGGHGVVVTGDGAPRWAQAMRAAGAPVREVDGTAGLGLPVRPMPGPALVDPSGGVLAAGEVAELLTERVGDALERRPVRSLEPAGSGVRVDGERFDACVLAAGAGTPALAAQVGMTVPGQLSHHCRFTVTLRGADTALDTTAGAALDTALDTAVGGGDGPPCLLDKGGAWRPGFTSYQQLTGPGRWAVGAHWPDAVSGLHQIDRAAFVAEARARTVEYVRENLPGADPEPVEELYCDNYEGWGDGFEVRRAGGVLAVYGDNLFKLAPVLGERLAAAALDGSTPGSVRAR